MQGGSSVDLCLKHAAWVASRKDLSWPFSSTRSIGTSDFTMGTGWEEDCSGCEFYDEADTRRVFVVKDQKELSKLVGFELHLNASGIVRRDYMENTTAICAPAVLEHLEVRAGPKTGPANTKLVVRFAGVMKLDHGDEGWVHPDSQMAGTTVEEEKRGADARYTSRYIVGDLRNTTGDLKEALTQVRTNLWKLQCVTQANFDVQPLLLDPDRMRPILHRQASDLYETVVEACGKVSALVKCGCEMARSCRCRAGPRGLREEVKERLLAARALKKAGEEIFGEERAIGARTGQALSNVKIHGGTSCKGTYTDTYTYTYTRTHTHSYTYTYTRTHTHTHPHMYTYTRMHTHTHTHAHARARARTCARAHARTRTPTHMHTHVHTYTHIHTQRCGMCPAPHCRESVQVRGLW
jgi:hypothetical protein